jgi:hypothetical protein
MGPPLEANEEQMRKGGIVARSAGAAEAVPTSPFLPDVNHPRCALVSRLREPPRPRPRLPRGLLLTPHELPGSLRGCAPQRGSRGLAPWPNLGKAVSLDCHAPLEQPYGRHERPHPRRVREGKSARETA